MSNWPHFWKMTKILERDTLTPNGKPKSTPVTSGKLVKFLHLLGEHEFGTAFPFDLQRDFAT